MVSHIAPAVMARNMPLPKGIRLPSWHGLEAEVLSFVDDKANHFATAAAVVPEELYPSIAFGSNRCSLNPRQLTKHTDTPR